MTSATAIARAVSGIADGDTLEVGQKFTVDADAYPLLSWRI